MCMQFISQNEWKFTKSKGVIYKIQVLLSSIYNLITFHIKLPLI